MTVDVNVDGHPWKVGIEPAERPGQFAVTVKGKRRVIDASWIDADTLSLLDGALVHEIRLERRENGAVAVEIGGRVYDVLVDKKKLREPFSGDGEKKAPGAISIKAPMPGRVVRVLVAVGDRVTARQGVVVVEAMKMENELRAPGDGIVKEVAARPGAVVESGTVLIVLGIGD
jgi:biotin carboxyl carrier protein